jgi:hypothetical protein
VSALTTHVYIAKKYEVHEKIQYIATHRRQREITERNPMT